MDTNSSFVVTCFIIDDEQAAHTALRRLIASVPWLKITGQSYSSSEAAKMIIAKRPDLLFLDVKMPGLSGLELHSRIDPPKPHVILTTAFREYAFEGYEHDAIAFLLKPFSMSRFHSAVTKAKELLMAKAVQLQGSAVYIADDDSDHDQAAAQLPFEDDSIWIYSGKKHHHFKLHEIYAVQGLKDYVKVHSSMGVIVVKGNIGSIERKLPASEFVRIHRSYIVNRSAIRVIEGNTLKMPDGVNFTIPASKNKESVIEKLLNRKRRL